VNKINSNIQPAAGRIARKGRNRKASSAPQHRPQRKTRLRKGIEEFLRLHQGIGSINEYGDRVISGVRIC